MNKEDREEFKELLTLIVKPIVDQQMEHHRTLFGNGTDSNQGLWVDVDRIKETEKSRVWYFRTMFVAVSGLVLKTVAGMIHWVADK